LPPRRIRVEGPVEVKSGDEWHSRAFRLSAGDSYELTVLSDNKVYAGLFHASEYARRRGAVAGMFDFPAGSDRRSFYFEGTVDQTGDYYIVIRCGVFSSDSTVDLKFRVTPAGG
jgi:hypothetical protein